MEIQTLKVGILQTNCYVLISKKTILIIDPGGDATKIKNVVKQNWEENYKVKILNTHYHYDHTLANKKLAKIFNADILIHENEKNFISFQPNVFLKDNDVIEIGEKKLKVLHTPGHTKGSICLLLEDENLLFTGDTIFDQGVGRTDLPGGSQEDLETSIKKIVTVFKTGMTIYPGHGNSFVYTQ